jgi:ParB-like nuclease domain
MATVSFDSYCIDLPLNRIAPIKTITPALRATAKYKQIASSLREVGLVEPLAVFANPDGTYLLLDGHMRYDILKTRQTKTVRCLLATDDEAHTYNKRVSRLSAIEEHRMILKAIARYQRPNTLAQTNLPFSVFRLQSCGGPYIPLWPIMRPKMNELIVAEKFAEWQRLKALVLDSVSSPITRRVYNMALEEFLAWFRLEPRPGFTKATVSAWRVSLEARGLGSSSIIIRMSAIRKLAVIN